MKYTEDAQRPPPVVNLNLNSLFLRARKLHRCKRDIAVAVCRGRGRKPRIYQDKFSSFTARPENTNQPLRLKNIALT